MNFVPGMHGVAGLMRSAAGLTVPVYRAIGTSVITTGSVTPPLPAGNSNADYDVLLLASNSYLDFVATITAGWTRIGSVQTGAYPDVMNLVAYGRKMDGTEGNPTVTITAAINQGTAAQILAFTNVDPTYPFEAIMSGSEASQTPALLRPETFGASRLAFNIGALTCSGTLPATPASGWTERIDLTHSTTPIGLYCQTLPCPVAGLTPAGTWTISKPLSSGLITKLAFALIPVGGYSVLGVWSPTDKGPEVTLSNGNITATLTGGSAVRSISSRSTGKLYFEMTHGMPGATHNENGFGLVNSAPSMSIGHQGGTTTDYGFYLMEHGGLRADVGNLYTSIAAMQPTGRVAGVAIDIPNKKFFIRIAGAWQSSAEGGGDPGAGGAGWVYTNSPGPLFIYCTERDAGYNNTWSLNVGASAFVGAVPAGYTAWG
jgi:hypothetical protein